MTTKTMAAVVQHGLEAGKVELREAPVPTLSDDDVLLNVGAVGVCGSDVHQYHSTQSWAVNVPVVLGHEFTGTVAAVGKRVRGFEEGDRVVSETAARICGTCIYCRTGNYNVCPHRLGFGYGVDGAMAKYVAAPARCLHHLPPDLPFEVAALTEPCCVAFNAVAERTTIRPGDTVLVLGPGPIGLLCMLVAQLQGAGAVVVSGLTADRKRLELARSLGATHTVDSQTEDLMELLRSLGDGYGVDRVFDASGAAAAVATAMDAVRPMGSITKVGWGPGPLGASLDPLVAKAATVVGCFSHNYPTWERVIGLLASGLLDPRPLVGLDSGLEDWKTAFDGMHSGRYAKAVLRP
ncbi:MAG: zinc-binding dehydrogenase [Chloroflexia bacterium]